VPCIAFSTTAARARAQETLTAADAEVRKLLFPAQANAALAPGEALLGRTWVTRKPLWAARLARPCLTRRFVDPEATLTWLEKTQPLPENALGFGFEGAHFTNSE